MRFFRSITYVALLMSGVLFVLFMAALTSNNPPPEIAPIADNRELSSIIRIFFFVSCLYGLLQFFWMALERENEKLQVQLEKNMKNALSEHERRERKKRQRRTRIRRVNRKGSKRRHTHIKPLFGVKHE